MYFYKNIILNVFADRIEKINYTQNNTQVWSNNIIPRNFADKPRATKITKNEAGGFELEILNKDSKYLRVLINTSRFYWLKDANDLQEDMNPFGLYSQNLTAAENLHQKNEFLNKMYCLGYLLHEHKIKQKSYIVIGTDHKIGKDANDNKGGSGKSAIITGLYSLIPNHYESNGRDLNKDTERFKYTNVDEELRLLHFDEMNPFFDLSKFFTDTTGDVTANWKGGKMLYIPFEFFTKIAITMNSVPRDIDHESFSRRSLNFETSDFYHEKNDKFSEVRRVSDSFNGQELFRKEYTELDWQNDDNFLMECLQFYLANDKKIEVDGQNLMKRNRIQKVGIKTHKFLTQFFEDFNNPKSDLGNTEDLQFVSSRQGIRYINKVKMYEIYKDELGKDAKSLQDFKDALTLFFDVNQISYSKQKINGNGRTVEHFCFNTIQPAQEQEPQTEIETITENENVTDTENDAYFEDIPY